VAARLLNGDNVAGADNSDLAALAVEGRTIAPGAVA
jgi:hypothetical protein